jgi:AcrR family transcriptional regulator
MARRSDHSRPELRDLMVVEGSRHMAEAGFARFSAREVAKRVGYSVGTIYNVFGSYDGMMVAINTRTFGLWAAHLEARLADGGADRIQALVEGYFSFARTHRNLWMAIYDHRLPPGVPMPEADAAERALLTAIIVTEIAAALPDATGEAVETLSRSLIATVHGHCVFDLSGSFALLGETDPIGAALTRVRQALAGERGA